MVKHRTQASWYPGMKEVGVGGGEELRGLVIFLFGEVGI